MNYELWTMNDLGTIQRIYWLLERLKLKICISRPSSIIHSS